MERSFEAAKSSCRGASHKIKWFLFKVVDDDDEAGGTDDDDNDDGNPFFPPQATIEIAATMDAPAPAPADFLA